MLSPSCRTSRAQTSAFSSPRLNHTGRTWVGRAALRRKGSSPLSTRANPRQGWRRSPASPCRCSPDCPGLPMWDTPMQVMMPTSGRAHFARRLISPACSCPSPRQRTCIPADAEHGAGRPSSLFWLPSVLICTSKARDGGVGHLLQVVFTLPVTPTTFVELAV